MVVEDYDEDQIISLVRLSVLMCIIILTLPFFLALLIIAETIEIIHEVKRI